MSGIFSRRVFRQVFHLFLAIDFVLILVSIFVGNAVIRVGAREISLDDVTIPLKAFTVCTFLLLLLSYDTAFPAIRRLARGNEKDGDRKLTAWLLGFLVLTGFLLRVARNSEYGLNADVAAFSWVASNSTLVDVWRIGLTP